MICYYPPHATQSDWLGFGKPIDVLSCTVKETAGGSYEADLEIPIIQNGSWKEIGLYTLFKIPVPGAVVPQFSYTARYEKQYEDQWTYTVKHNNLAVYEEAIESSVELGRVSSGTVLNSWPITVKAEVGEFAQIEKPFDNAGRRDHPYAYI